MPSLQQTIRTLKEARENRTTAIKEFKGRLYEEFDTDRGVWLRAVRVLAELDCLFSLAKASVAIGEPSCRPEFVEADAAFIEFKDLRHPTLAELKASFIPNDIKLGGDVGRIALLTGTLRSIGRNYLSLKLVCRAKHGVRVCSSHFSLPSVRLTIRPFRGKSTVSPRECQRIIGLIFFFFSGYANDGSWCCMNTFVSAVRGKFTVCIDHGTTWNACPCPISSVGRSGASVINSTSLSEPTGFVPLMQS